MNTVSPDAPEEFRSGVAATLPFLPGVFPFGMAYAVTAVAAGFTPLETVLISLVVCAGGAQMAFIAIAASGGGALPAVLTAAALNLRYILYGLAASVWLPRKTDPPRPILAATMTDEGFALATAEARHGRPSSRFLWGANLSMCVMYWVGTLAGLLLGQLLPNPEALGIDVIFPLSFMAILAPMLRTRVDLLVAVVGGMGAVALRGTIGAGPAILIAVLLAACLGATLDGRWQRQ